jgi:hypothetical protein|tara:strand:- start:3269 stop:3451 length:183 start_codon:yes stop_codon:yes gene_type:complete
MNTLTKTITPSKKRSSLDYKNHLDSLERQITGRNNIYTEHSWNPSCSEVYHNGRTLHVVT